MGVASFHLSLTFVLLASIRTVRPCAVGELTRGSIVVDVFAIRDQLISDYRGFTSSFVPLGPGPQSPPTSRTRRSHVPPLRPNRRRGRTRSRRVPSSPKI